MTDPSASAKRTPLHAEHVALRARLVDFAGWEMPVYYAGILREHEAVRTRAGVFDISHMGQFVVDGPQAEIALNRLLTNNVGRLDTGQAQYTLLLNERGGVIDDLIVYRLGEARFLLVVNAAWIAEDAAWIAPRLREAGVEFDDASERFGAIAVQGPASADVFARMIAAAGMDVALPPRNGVATATEAAGELFVCRTGYTGEDGFELVCPADATPDWWRRALDAGADPCGLGARDSLRLEMGFPLNGADLSSERTPLEAGLGYFVDLSKGDFVGRDALVAQKAGGVPSKLCAIRATEKCPPPRPHYPVLAEGREIGELSSGGLSPSLGAGIGMAYLPAAYSKIDTAIQIAIRGKPFAATVVKKPLYRKPSA